MNVAVLGLPGAGKTTVARILAARLGTRHVSTGEELRARAASDPELRAVLARGELAPEAVVRAIVQEAAARGDAILDGFPRHVGQLELAVRLFPGLQLVFLSVTPSVALTRLGLRAGTAARPEDAPESLVRRLEIASRDLAPLREAAEPSSVFVVDGERPPDAVADTIKDFLLRR